jgi:hypothetical protein
MVTLSLLSHDNLSKVNLARGDSNFADIWSNFLKGGLKLSINTVYKYRFGIDSSDCRKPVKWFSTIRFILVVQCQFVLQGGDKNFEDRWSNFLKGGLNPSKLQYCAAHVCTLFSSTVNP